MTKTFRKDTERCRQRGYDMELSRLPSDCLKQKASFRSPIALINCLEIMEDAGNVA